MTKKKFNPAGIESIEWYRSNGTITAYFTDDQYYGPFEKEEFTKGSPTRVFLEELERELNRRLKND